MNKFLVAACVIIIAVASLLRFYKLGTLISPYWEEVALGYDAYSLLKTGRDHHGNPWPIVAFESFGDWKPSAYFYAAMVSIWAFGLKVWAVRFPSALFGVIFVLSMGVLARFLALLYITQNKTRANLIAIVTLFLAAVEPWTILLSRAAWETNLALSLLTLALALQWMVYYFYPKLQKKQLMLLLLIAALCAIVSTYTYHANRVISPLLWFITLGFQLLHGKRKETGQFLVKIALLPSLFFVAGLIPLLWSLWSSSALSTRVAQTSIFSDLSIIEESNSLRETHGYSLISRIVYHRYALYGRTMLIHALSHTTPQFLFLSGDTNVRHSVGFFGQLYLLDAFFILVGLYTLFKKNKALSFYLVLVSGVAVLPASITVGVPHALRSASLLIVLILLSAVGIVAVYQWAISVIDHFGPNKQSLSILAMSGLLCTYTLLLIWFWRYYAGPYRHASAREWQYGYEQMISKLNQTKQNNSQLPVYITREQGRPAMYYWFFSQTDPSAVQAEARSVLKDQSEFLSYKNIYFVRSVHEVKTTEALIASSPEFKTAYLETHPSLTASVFGEVADLDGNTIWQLYEIK